MTAIWQTITHTPWWVFAVFFYVLKVGISATRPRIVRIKKLFLLPAVLLALSLNSLLTSFSLTIMTGSIYAMTLAFGMIGGWMFVRKLDLSFDHTRRLVKVPGSFLTLFLILTIFFTKYYLGYTSATHPEKLLQARFVVFQICLSGISAGLLLGRLVCYLFRKSRSAHEDLSPIQPA